jgi:hypothetical protein
MVRIGRRLLGKCGTEGPWFFSCWTSEFTAPQQANGSSVLVCWNENRPNASVLLAVTCHCVQPAVSSLDIHAEVKTFLSNTLCIAAEVWDLRFSQHCCWRVRGLVQAPTFWRIVVLEASVRMFDAEDLDKLQKWWPNGLLSSTSFFIPFLCGNCESMTVLVEEVG